MTQGLFKYPISILFFDEFPVFEMETAILQGNSSCGAASEVDAIKINFFQRIADRGCYLKIDITDISNNKVAIRYLPIIMKWTENFTSPPNNSKFEKMPAGYDLPL